MDSEKKKYNIHRAVISGATGAIGTALVQLLIDKGIELLIIIRPDSIHKNRIPEHPLVKVLYADMRELANLQIGELDKMHYDVFYHFAWRGTVGDARNDMYLQNENVRCALDTVHLAHRLGCHTFIGAGSQAEYGRVEALLSEDTATYPENGYGMAKLCAGQMTRELAHSLGMRHIWPRILSVYGPCDGENSLVSSVIRSALNHESPKCTRGEQQWDFLYSKDAAKALYLLAEYGIDGGTYVLGSGQVRPLAEYICTICAEIDSNIQPDLGAIPYSSKQVMYLGADISKLNRDTGFEPEYSFKDGIKETIRWWIK